MSKLCIMNSPVFSKVRRIAEKFRVDNGAIIQKTMFWHLIGFKRRLLLRKQIEPGHEKM